MTGPLANEFAQVRGAVRCNCEDAVECERTDEALAALARIEEHTHNTEKALAQIASDIHPARPADEERPRWLHENSVWWNHYSPQEIARAALSAGEGTPA